MPVTKTLNFLPTVFQSETNQKFLNATMDQLVTEPNLVTINGYVGRKFAPGEVDVTEYVREPSTARADYQLEPSVIVKETLSGNVDFHVAYPEVLQKIAFYGGKTDNQSRLWSQEYYSYNPLINFDAFINFNQYYWLPDGPSAVNVFAGGTELEKTYYIYPDSAAGVYNISGFGTVSNPDLVLARGGNYQFKVKQPGKPFWIQTDPGVNGTQIANSNLTSRQIFGVTGNGTDDGTVYFNVPDVTAQDVFVTMPTVQNVDFATNLKFNQLQGQLVSTINAAYGGIDGQQTNWGGKFLIFTTLWADDADWTVGATTVPFYERTGIFEINLSPSGSDYVVDLDYVADIPLNNKVAILSGIQNGNTEWFKNPTYVLELVPIVTANLDTLYYQDGSDPTQVGVIKIVDPNTASINIDTDILGKKNYISPNGVTFTNGLKIRFDINVTPESYQEKEYYVDGVGIAITLTPVTNLVVNFALGASNYDPTTAFTGLATATYDRTLETLSISTGDVPANANISYGTFPNSINSNYIITQDINLSLPYKGGLNDPGEHVSTQLRDDVIGMTAVGIPIFGTYGGEYVPGGSGTQWHLNTTTVKINGQDVYNGFVDDEGIYQYTDSSFITANAWGNVSGFTVTDNGYLDVNGHSKIVGFASDGYPIYGPFGYSNALSSSSSIIRMVSGYTANVSNPDRPQSQTVNVALPASSNIITVNTSFDINPGMRITTNDAGILSGTVWVIRSGQQTIVGLNGHNLTVNQIQLSSNVTVSEGNSLTFAYLPGAFIEDYTFSSNVGTLDEYNGRFCVTPEYPNGTYAYFATQDNTNTPTYPYFIGSAFFGSLENDTNSNLSEPEYITINRSSRDLNPWSRRNRWFHKDVITATAIYNNTIPLLDQNYKAKRPIIEFDPNIQLFDFGINGLQPIDLLDKTTTNPFLTFEGATSAEIDGIELVNNMRVIFTADEDPLTRNKIWVVNFVELTPGAELTIHLELASDGNVQANDTVSVFSGETEAGNSYYYNGSVWDQGQRKIQTNQPPLFDIVDKIGISFSDRSKYPPSVLGLTFNGNKIFSYTEGSGVNDPVLGFPLAYKNLNNIGDIEFTNNYDTELFRYTVDQINYVDKVNTGDLIKNNDDGSKTRLNVWTTVVQPSRQYQVIPYVFDGITNSFLIDVMPDQPTSLPTLQVYVNFKLLKPTQYQIFNLPQNKKSITIRPSLIEQGDKIDILVISKQVSQLGYYEIPVNLNYNAQNFVLNKPTLGDIRNHIGELTENSLQFKGQYPGNSNLRDIYVAAQGGTILQQSAPTTLSSMFLCDEQMNVVNAILNAQQEYTRFKNKFLNIASTDANVNVSDPISAVDYIIQQINQIKNKTFPWYYSDMIPYGDNKQIITYNIFDPLERRYEITNLFDMQTLSNRAVLVYLNNQQLVWSKDYVFNPTLPAVELLDRVVLEVDDTLTIVEYADTDGNWIPETPTKLGLYPKFVPIIYTDDTYRTPVQMIKGHDGSLMPAFNDFRDAILLELERRIYNNIKVEYNEKLFSIYDSKPGKFRNIGYTQAEWSRLLARVYLPWTGFNNLDYVTNSTFVTDNPWTYNYAASLDVVDSENLPGSWRACFDYFYDCQTPHLRPWEMLGFSEEPDWWQDTYGPAPYTSGNTILWTDLENGYIAAGPRQGIDPTFTRPGLSQFIPVNVNGEPMPPIGLLTNKYNQSTFNKNWQVGQWSPVETAWRNTSEYPFAFQLLAAVTQPAKYFAVGATINKYKFNEDLQQFLIQDTNYRLTQQDIEVNGYVTLDNTIQRSASYINWIGDYLTTLGILNKGNLLRYIRDYSVQLSYRMAGFSGKNYLKILAEQNSPNSINQSVIIPDSDFAVELNKSTPLNNVRYSAVIIEKLAEGWSVSGYDFNNPYFTVIIPTAKGSNRTVSSLNLSVDWFTEFTNLKVNVPYQTVFDNNQQIATFLCGYQRFLQSQGFRFDYYDPDLAQIRNWDLSAKEFLFWVEQGWPAGSVLILSPIADNLKFQFNAAVVDGIENTFYGTKVMTQNYVVLDSDAYTVNRDNNVFKLSLDNKTGDLIGFVSLNLVQYEHVIIFNNITQFNDIIYDPASGQRQYKMKVVGKKTGDWTGQLAAPGFVYNSPGVISWRPDTDYLKGDLIEYKGFYYAASKDLPGTPEFIFANWIPVDKDKIQTGLLPNFATNAGLSVDFYDVDGVNLDSKFDLYSLGLIGYRNRSYLNDLGVDDTTQVKFYQGFIKQKGTLNAINALANVSFNNENTSVNINEEWAFRVGAYGSLATNQYVELVLDESYTLNNPTSLLVNSNNVVTYTSLYNDGQGLYKTSEMPFSSPFLLNRTNNSIRTDDIQTAGYASLEDVDFTIFDIKDLNSLNGNLNNIGVGSTIWAAKSYANEWEIYRVNETYAEVQRIDNSLNGFYLITTNVAHNFATSDIVLLKNCGVFSGFYQVEIVPTLNTFIINFGVAIPDFNSLVTISSPAYKLTSQRFTYGSEIKSSTPIEGYRANSKVWVDNATINNTWAVYNKSNPWLANTSLSQSETYANLNYGSATHITQNNEFIVVGASGFNNGVGRCYTFATDDAGNYAEKPYIDPYSIDSKEFGITVDGTNDVVVIGAPGSRNDTGYVFYYSRNFLGQINLQQVIGTNVSGARFGQSVSVSDDGEWLYVGAPNEDAVYVYSYNTNIPLQSDTVVGNGVATVFTLSYTPVDQNTLVATLIDTPIINYVPGVDFTVTGATITFTSPPTANVAVVQRAGFQFVDKILGTAGSKFGYSVATSTGGAQVVVGAPDLNVNGDIQAGGISVYDRSIEKFIANGSQSQFGGQRPVQSYSKVYIDANLQATPTNYTVSGNNVNFTTNVSAGSIVTIETDEFYKIQDLYPADNQSEAKFGYSVDLCSFNCSIYAGAPFESTDVRASIGSVYRFLNQGRVYGTITGTVQNPVVTANNSIRLNDFEVVFSGGNLTSIVNSINNADIPGVTATNVGGYLTINSDSVLVADKLRVLPGVGNTLDQLGLTVFEYVEEITNPTANPYDNFGKIVKINDSSDVLAVGSDNGITVSDCTFDNNTTTFDAISTSFSDAITSGAVWVFSYIQDARNNIDNPGNFNFVQQISPQGNALVSGANFGSGLDFKNYRMVIGSTDYTGTLLNQGQAYLYTNPQQLTGWDVIREESPKVDISCILKSYVYSVNNQTIINNLDYIDPAKGKILGNAEQDITYKTDYDPAIYNVTNLDNVSEDTIFHWNNNQVGQVWWDLSAVRYLDYEQGSIKYRANNWGREFPGSSIDVYEWVESIYPPSQYVANGGNGIPKYLEGQNAYVALSYVDPATNQPTVKYYFWVKDKTVVTINQFGRTIPTTSIADLIRNPKGSGIRYFAAIRDDAVAVYNMVGLPVGKDTIFHLDYATLLNSNIIHSEYALVSEKAQRSEVIPTNIYNKLVDSACGADIFGNNVPDPFLTPQTRYGIDFRPRQTIFVNRFEAIKEMVSFVNRVFSKNLISQNYDLSTLNSVEPIPPVELGLYDITVPTYETLGYIDITIQPIGYSVLVESDATVSGLWTIYIKQANNTWLLTRVQAWYTPEYWEFVDWYADGFDSGVKPTYTVNTPADLSTLQLQPRDIVKILNNGRGKWVVVQVFRTEVVTIAVESGTIALKDNLYDLEKYGMGFGNGNFDIQRFDQNPSIELRFIFNALKNDIFINQLGQEFINLFFVFINYVLNEQKYIDWAFKTSFITVLHKIRGLTQPPLFRTENQDYYKQYIEEVKPYHTTIREYIIDYQGADNLNGYVTDFDVPAYYDSVLNQWRSPSGEFFQDGVALQEPKYRDWLLNYSYSIGSLEIADAGSGYTLPPVITITGSTIGNDAVAKAIVSNGVISRIEVLYGGSNYITQPIVTITGGNGSGARAYAILKNETTRKLKTTLVYDRITYGTDVINWEPNTSYVAGQIIAYNGVAYTVNSNFTSDDTFNGNNLTIYQASGFRTANDRIQSYYQPEVGLPGKDFAQLQSGIEYPGVGVQGILYTDVGGFDAYPFDSDPFDLFILDEDGNNIYEESILDSKISSLYTDTSLGVDPEDIDIDGGAYVDQYSSHAPEELIPGRTYDTLDLTVKTFATLCNTTAYSDWVSNTAFYVETIDVLDGGSGYSSSNVVVTVVGNAVSTATANAVLDSNGTITSITVISSGLGYTEIPNIVITGGNLVAANAVARLSQNTYSTFDYRIFKDMNDNWQYAAITATANSTLVNAMTITSNTISLVDSSGFYIPDVDQAIPGVVFINGERITYWENDTATNTLKQIRRGTAGTGAVAHAVNSEVVNGSINSTVPRSQYWIWEPSANTSLITTSGNVAVWYANTSYFRSEIWYNQGLSVYSLSEEYPEALPLDEIPYLMTESNSSIVTNQEFSTATDGNGLYASDKVQAVFIK